MGYGGIVNYLKKIRSLIQILILALLTSSCSNKESTVYLKVNQIDGLTTEAGVTANGFQIGYVDEISLEQQGQIIIKLHLDSEHHIPKDTKFKIEKRDILGAKGISVELGEDEEGINAGDTFPAMMAKNFLQSDSLVIKIEGIFESLKGAAQRDSILVEAPKDE